MADQETSAVDQTVDEVVERAESVKDLLIDDDDLSQNPVRDEKRTDDDEEMQAYLDGEEDGGVKEAKAKQTEMEDDEEEEDDEDAKEEKPKAESKEKDKPSRSIRDLTEEDENLITRAVASGVVNLSDALELHDAGKLRKIMERITQPDGQSKQEPADDKASAQADTGANSAKLFKHRLTKEDYPDENIVGFAEEVEDHVAKVNQKVQTQEQLVQYLINQNAAMRIDRLFSKIGDEYSDAFGKGDIDEVSEPQQNNRARVMRVLNALAESSQKSGEKKSTKELFQQAIDSLYAERRETKAKTEAERERQKERRMPQPSSTKITLTREQIADQKWKLARQAEAEETANARKKFALKTV